MKVDVITLFPELVEQVTRHGMPRIAVEGGQLQLSTRNPRDYSTNKWRRVDARPYGGGPGMVMEAEPLAAAISDAKAALGSARVVSLRSEGGRVGEEGVSTCRYRGSPVTYQKKKNTNR